MLLISGNGKTIGRYRRIIYLCFFSRTFICRHGCPGLQAWQTYYPPQPVTSGNWVFSFWEGGCVVLPQIILHAFCRRSRLGCLFRACDLFLGPIKKLNKRFRGGRTYRSITFYSLVAGNSFFVLRAFLGLARLEYL